MNSKSVKEGGIKSMYSKSKRFIASFLAVLMAVCMLPVDMFGVAGVVNAAAPTVPKAAPALDPAGTAGAYEFAADAADTSVKLGAYTEDDAADVTIYWVTSADSVDNFTSIDKEGIVTADKHSVAAVSAEGHEVLAEVTDEITVKAVAVTTGTEDEAAQKAYSAITTVTYSVAEPVIDPDTKTDISGATVTLTAETVEAGGEMPTVALVKVTVNDTEQTLTLGTDYEVKYSIDNEDKTVEELKALTVAEDTTVTVTISAIGDTYTGNKTATFTITPKQIVTVSQPTATPGAGKVTEGTTVTLSAGAGADIYAVTKTAAEGFTAPTATDIAGSEDNKYTAPIAVSEAMTIYAVAKVGDDLSDVASFEYTIKAAGEVNPFELVLDFSTFTKGDIKIYNDGYFNFEHDKTGTISSKTFTVDTNNTYITEGGNYSYYNPGGSIAAGNSKRAVKFTLSSKADVIIGGSANTANQKFGLLKDDKTALDDAYNSQTCSETNKIYELKLTNLEAGKEYAVGSTDNKIYLNYIIVKEKDYQPTKNTIVASEPAGPVQAGTKVSFKAPKGIDIYLAEGETVTTDDANKYNGTEIEITETKKITVVAKAGNAVSAAETYEYTIAQPIAALPTATVQSGVYEEAQSVTLSSTTENAKVYYTTDGTNPVGNVNAQEATGAITVNKTQTIKAYAKSDATQASDVLTLTYIIKSTATKTYSVNPGEVDGEPTVPSEGGEVFVGTDNYFRLLYKNTGGNIFQKVSEIISSNANAYDITQMEGWPTDEAGALNTESKALIVTGGTIEAPTGATVRNAVKIIVSAPAKLTAYHAVKNGTETKLQVYQAPKTKFDDTELGTAINGDTTVTSTNASVGKEEVTLPEAGIYYIGFAASGGIIPYMEVTENPSANSEETVTLTFTNGESTTTKEVTKGEKYTFTNDDKLADTTEKKFKGWAKTADATVTDVITDITPTDDTTLYAVWADLYKVELENGTETYDGFPVTVEEGESVTLPSATTTDTTKVFSGWKEKDVEDAPTIQAGAYVPTKTITLVPVFVDADSVIIVTRDYGYKEEGAAANKTDTFTVPKNESGKATVTLELLKTDHERDGYTFDKWVILNEEGEEGAEVEAAGVEIENPTTFLAKWTVIVQPTTYSVAFVKEEDGDSLNVTVKDKENNTISDLTKVTENTIIVLPDAPETKPDGKDAWKWKEYKDDTFVTEYAVDAEYTVISDVTFKGYWTDSETPGDEGDEENEDNYWWYEDKAEIKKANNGKIPEGLWMAGLYQEGNGEDDWDEGAYYYNAGLKVTPHNRWGDNDDIRVYYHTHLLTFKTDYTVSYKNNVNAAKADAAKAPTIIISGKGSYSGKVDKTFTIRPYPVDWIDDYDYSEYVPAKKNNAAQQIVPTLIHWYGDEYKPKKKKLSNKKDFELVYYKTDEYNKVGENEDGSKKADDLAKIALTSVTEPGNYKVVATGKNNYCGSMEFDVTVLASDAKLASKLKVTVAKISYDKAVADAQGFAGFEPAVTVKDGRDTLTALAYDDKGQPTNEAAADYSLTYYNNREAGTGTVAISPVTHTSAPDADGKTTTTQKFYGTKWVSFKIAGNPIKSAKVTYDGDLTYKYDGSGIIDASKIKVSYKGSELKPYNWNSTTGKFEGDYEINGISGNWYAGKATVYIVGRGLYEGTLNKTFKIAPYDISSATVTLAGATTKPEELKAVFSKGGCYPEIVVKCTFGEGENARTYTLDEGVDYTLSYKNNNNFKKAPEITIKGKGDYKGTLKKTFTFDEKDLSTMTLEAPDVPLLSKAGKYGSKPVITDKSGVKTVNLAVKKDYTLEYFDVTPKSATPEKPDTPAAQADGEGTGEGAATPTTPGETKIDNINRFTATKDTVIKVVATAVSGSGYKGTVSATYKVHENDFSKVTVKVNPQEYAGKDVTLKAEDITVTPKGGSALTVKASKDSTEDGYYIDASSYVNNNKKGTAKVTLIGTGSYAGSKTVTFKITARKMEWAALTPKVEKTVESITNAIKDLFN